MQANYGPNGFDVKFLYNAAVYYAPPVFKGQHGVAGHLLGGWTISPLFTAQSGANIGGAYYSEGTCGSDCQSFGESSSGSMTSTADYAVGAAKYTGSSTAVYNSAGTNGTGTNNPTHINQFSDPGAVFNEFRPCVLGIDTSCGGYGNMRGLSDLEPGCDPCEGCRPVERGTRGRRPQLPVHQHPEPHAAGQWKPEPQQPGDVRQNHHAGQYAAAVGIRAADSLLNDRRMPGSGASQDRPAPDKSTLV